MNGRGGIITFFLFLFLLIIVLLQVLSMGQADQLWAEDKCLQQMPMLEEANTHEKHLVACWKCEKTFDKSC